MQSQRNTACTNPTAGQRSKREKRIVDAVKFYSTEEKVMIVRYDLGQVELLFCEVNHAHYLPLCRGRQDR